MQVYRLSKGLVVVAESRWQHLWWGHTSLYFEGSTDRASCLNMKLWAGIEVVFPSDLTPHLVSSAPPAAPPSDRADRSDGTPTPRRRWLHPDSAESRRTNGFNLTSSLHEWDMMDVLLLLVHLQSRSLVFKQISFSLPLFLLLLVLLQFCRVHGLLLWREKSRHVELTVLRLVGSVIKQTLHCRTLPCWNCSRTICRLDSDTAYCWTCSWDVLSWARALSLCCTATPSCSCRDSTCMLACWLDTNTGQLQPETSGQNINNKQRIT